MEYAQKLLEQIGLQGRRVQMINLSSAMGGQFAFSIAELTAEIKQMGANPLNNVKDLAGLKSLESESR